MKRNSILTFFFSLVPGAGQMYQGYMKRGLSLTLVFVLPIFLAYAFMPPLLAFSAVAYMYSFFDSLNLHAKLKESGSADYREIQDDDFVVHLSCLQNTDFKRIVNGQHHLLGWGLIAIGVVTAYRSLILPILENLLQYLEYEGPLANAIWSIIRHLPNLTAAVILVLVGMWLIRGPKQKPEEEYEEYKGEEND